ncbi:MAG: hydroxymethylbilane synthase [Methermicoccaceae archaeon]
MKLRIGTRGSTLALAQANKVKHLLEQRGHQCELVIVRTKGDVVRHTPIYNIGDVGMFVKKIDEYQLAGKFDIAVHSMKDIPSKRPDGLVLSAVLERESPYDCAITNGCKFEELPRGSIVGTGSLRRMAQVARLDAGLLTKAIRGNVDTRIEKLQSGEYDAIILSEAGAIRLGLDMECQILDKDNFLPSPNQGVIACVCREGEAAESIVREITHPPTELTTSLERKVMNELGGGCSVPIGVLALQKNKEVEITAEVLSRDGKKWIRVKRIAKLGEKEILKVAEDVASELIDKGALTLIQETQRSERGAYDS